MTALTLLPCTRRSTGGLPPAALQASLGLLTVIIVVIIVVILVSSYCHHYCHPHCHHYCHHRCHPIVIIIVIIIVILIVIIIVILVILPPAFPQASLGLLCHQHRSRIFYFLRYLGNNPIFGAVSNFCTKTKHFKNSNERSSAASNTLVCQGLAANGFTLGFNIIISYVFALF